MTQLTDAIPDPAHRRRWTPRTIAVAVAIPVLAAVAVVVIMVNGAAGKPAAATADQTATCLLGPWVQTSHLPTTVPWDGADVAATKNGGVSYRFGADGSGSVDYAMQLTAQRGSDTRVQAWSGEFTFDYTLDGATLAFRDVVDHTAVTTTLNGKTEGGPAHVPSEWTSDQVVCGPTSLTLTDAIGSTDFTRG